MKTKTNIIYLAFALFAFACFALAPQARAVCKQGCDLANDNTFLGDDALINNTTGLDNTAIGFQALYSNTSGGGNNAFGFGALFSSISGTRNLAVGSGALGDLTSGDSNVAVGNVALFQGVTVNLNTALGRRALFRSQGDQNVGLGFWAGGNLSDGGNNIYVGNVGPVPIGSESNTIRIGTQTATTVTAENDTHPMPAHTATFIAGIFGTTMPGGIGVVIDTNGRLGVKPSSMRFKDEIKPMDKASEAILALKPVTFRYKKEIDADRTPQFGLIAEEVEKVNPNLVARDDQGKPFTVRYEAVNAMLLNEFLKEHRKVQELEANDVEQQNAIKALTAMVKEQASQLQKVSAQLELNKRAPQIVVNNPRKEMKP
jgi:trimeric autotransporter adhesin